MASVFADVYLSTLTNAILATGFTHGKRAVLYYREKRVENRTRWHDGPGSVTCCTGQHENRFRSQGSIAHIPQGWIDSVPRERAENRTEGARANSTQSCCSPMPSICLILLLFSLGRSEPLSFIIVVSSEAIASYVATWFGRATGVNTALTFLRTHTAVRQGDTAD